MNYDIRPISKDEYPILEKFLYEAIYIPEGTAPPPRDIVSRPELQVYVRDFGSRAADLALCATVDGKIVGAVWGRIMDDYGHINNDIPSLAISLYKKFRGCGIGTALMREIILAYRKKGYKKLSLSVQKDNYAVKMYKNIGFETVSENDEESIMLYKGK